MALTIRALFRVTTRRSLSPLHNCILESAQLPFGCAHAAWLRADWKKIRLRKSYINSQRLLSWLSGFSWIVPGTSLPRVSSNAVEKDWICVFTRPSVDSSAHAASPCPNSELLGTFLDAQEDTVKKLVFLPRGKLGSWMGRVLKCTMECSESISALHGTGDDLTSDTHTHTTPVPRAQDP